jgi:hypothetical protein
LRATYRLLMLVPALILLYVSIGCKQQSGSPGPEALTMPNQIVVAYGDGKKGTLTNAEVVEKIFNQLKEFEYEKVKLPDTVGQKYTLKMNDGQDFLSTGYLRIDGNYYRVKDQEALLEFQEYIASVLPEQ